MSVATLGLALLAGVLSTLSPCVLPLIPIVLGTALSGHRFGPLALSLGLVISFAVLGTLITVATVSLGLSADAFRIAGAIVLAVFGVVLLSGALQRRMNAALAGAGAMGDSWLQRFQPEGLTGQLVVGLALGLVWSPCVGPTLGAAIGLASQGTQLPQISLVMAAFGMGAAIPLLIVGSLSRTALLRMRNGMLRAGHGGRIVLGVALLLIALAIITGLDKSLEALLTSISPEWLTRLTTRY